MKTSIKVNDSYVQKIMLGNIPVQRIYQSGSVVYDIGGSEPCFEVVDTISEATGDYVDVYAWDTSKWYKKNNLDQFEEYGVMPIVDSLSNITYYTGKLVILSTDNHEYRWSGNEWEDLGSAGTLTEYLFADPQPAGETECQYYPQYYYDNGYMFQVFFYLTPNYSYTSDYNMVGGNSGHAPIEMSFYSNGFYFDAHYPTSTPGEFTNTDKDYRIMANGSLNNYKGRYLLMNIQFNKVTVDDFHTGDRLYSSGSLVTKDFHDCGSVLRIITNIRLRNGSPAHVGWIKVFNNNNVLVNDIRPAIDSSNKLYLHDSLVNADYYSNNSYTLPYHTETIGEIVPPVDYDTKVAPANNVHYDSLAELELMECPWIGMEATISENYTLYTYTENGWELADPPLDLPYLRITATFETTITFNQPGLKYSIDGGSWKTLSPGVATPTIQPSSYVIFKGECTPTSSGIGKFSCSGRCTVSGNVMSLLYGDDFTDKYSLAGKPYAFYSLFNGNTNITSAENLVLPATTLSDYCYYGMFEQCSNLTTPPALPATTLAASCYGRMFSEASNLTTLPALPATTLAVRCYDTMFNYVNVNVPDNYLPATTLANYCYNAMFANASRRTSVMSELPATTLAEGCYQSMFLNNYMVSTAPVLPATTLVTKCYQDMFRSCSTLNSVTAAFTTTPGDRYTYWWLYRVRSTGTFRKNANATWDETITRGISTVPTDWTIEDIPSE